MKRTLEDFQNLTEEQHTALTALNGENETSSVWNVKSNTSFTVRLYEVVFAG